MASSAQVDRKDIAKESMNEDISSPDRVVPVDERLASIKNVARPVDKREALSAYFTIAAAAFGLISDGCESSTSIKKLHAFSLTTISPI